MFIRISQQLEEYAKYLPSSVGDLWSGGTLPIFHARIPQTFMPISHGSHWLLPSAPPPPSKQRVNSVDCNPNPLGCDTTVLELIPSEPEPNDFWFVWF